MATESGLSLCDWGSKWHRLGALVLVACFGPAELVGVAGRVVAATKWKWKWNAKGEGVQTEPSQWREETVCLENIGPDTVQERERERHKVGWATGGNIMRKLSRRTQSVIGDAREACILGRQGGSRRERAGWTGSQKRD